MFSIQEYTDRMKTHVHDDDIHAMLWTNTTTSSNIVSDTSTSSNAYQSFITGSKDNQVRLWEVNSFQRVELQREVRSPGNYQSWITALTRAFTSNHFIYGTRDGVIGFMHSDKGEIAQFELRKRHNPKCKTKNQNRITAVYSMHEYDRDLHEYILIGKPKSLLCARIHYAEGNECGEEDEVAKGEKAPEDAATPDASMDLQFMYEDEIHANDWVYCLYPINTSPQGNIFTCVVTGSSLHIYSLPSQPTGEIKLDKDNSIKESSQSKGKPKHVQHVTTVWEEDRFKVKEGNNRAHIAYLEGLKKTNPVWIGAACFDSAVRIFDLERQTLINTLRRGNNQRNWQCQEYEENLVLSCADDGYLRLWDLRVPSRKANVANSCRHKGRVSAFLINPLNKSIMTTSCSSNPNHPSSTGAALRMFDVRSFSKKISSAIDDLDEKLDQLDL